ncbi:MAG: polysaccharide biosynthesis tyrosine autokinase [Elusimicrobia bacterium]|nr:polysaccharide biosynthesis tyrosine autokinase [Elusimicrobiota bacterium]
MPETDQEIEINLSEYAEIVMRRRWIVLILAGTVFTAAACYAFLSTPVFRASTLLNIEHVGRDNGPVTQVPSEEQDQEYFETQYKLITSESALDRLYESMKLEQTKDFQRGIRYLRDKVSVVPLPHTRLCNVNVESTDPALAMRLSSALAQYFVEQNLNNKLFMSKDVLDALQMRMNGSEAQKVNESLPSVVNNRLVQDIKAQIFNAEAQLAEMRTKMTDSHPAVISLRSRLQSMHKVLDTEVGNIVQSLKTELSGQLSANNVRIVDLPRMPEKPVRPRKVLALVFGLLGGFALGVFAALMVEALDQTVRTHDDVEHKLGLSFLGLIPFSRHKKGAKIYAPFLSHDISLTSEAFRNLRTMLGFARASDKDPFVLITSSVQEEGKSFVATNLAVVLAQLGDKVLLVDGDLRRPRQHRNLLASNELGLTEFLCGNVADPAALVQKTEIPNLSIVTCGSRPPNPAELLHGEHLEPFLAWAKKHYGRIIVDCPPVFPVSDVLLWGRHVKSAVFVARGGRTRVPLMKTACARLRMGELKILGGVINAARLSTMTYADGRYYEQYYRDYSDPEPAKHKRT